MVQVAVEGRGVEAAAGNVEPTLIGRDPKVVARARQRRETGPAVSLGVVGLVPGNAGPFTGDRDGTAHEMDATVQNCGAAGAAGTR